MKIFKRILLFIFIIIIVGVTFLGINGYSMYKGAIDSQSIADRVSDLKNKKNYTTFDELPPYYIDAVISVEDHRFYNHYGVDFIATARAVFNDIIAMELKEGGSSITQQVAKNLCFNQKKSIYRKIAEIFVVYDLEKNYSKEEILEIYVNNMYFGNGYYNIYDASMRILS